MFSTTVHLDHCRHDENQREYAIYS